MDLEGAVKGCVSQLYDCLVYLLLIWSGGKMNRKSMSGEEGFFFYPERLKGTAPCLSNARKAD